ncbi:protein translocase subunit SecF [Candidatus Dependentiae bacterium]
MFNFLKYRYIALALSVSAIVLFLGLYFYKGGLTYSVEFTGGTQVLMRFEKPVNADDLRSVLSKNWPRVQPPREFSNKEFLVRVQAFENDTRGLADRMRQAVQEAMPDNPVTIDKSEAVGPGVGADLRWKSMRAVLLALLLMLFYIAWRFWSIGFAMGAVVALFHDAIMIVGMFLLLNRDISINVIGAILAMLGYSINDTIVIFARMRENIKKMRGASLPDIVNASLNQTFKRTLLTSFSTFLMVSPMFLFGGEVLRDFSLALLLGIFFGTYSSIYIASPLMMLLHKEEK